MKFTHTAMAAVLVAGLASGAWASGSGEHGHDDDGHMGHGGDMHGMQHEMGEHMDIDRTIEVTARDIEFSTSEIEVEPGETIRFVIHNEGMLDHDFTIGDRETQDAHRAEMQEMMGHMDDHNHGAHNAVMIPPGETRELVWTFSGEEDVMFGCNIPGHFEAGMHGDFEIENEE